jgi:hypothetical protein
MKDRIWDAMATDILRKLRAELSRLLALDGQAPKLGEVKLALIQGRAGVLMGLKDPVRPFINHLQSSFTGGRTPD